MADDEPGGVPLAQVLRERFLTHPRHGPLPALLLALTVVTGVVDAVSILRMGHVFVANMTGNVAFIGFGIAGAAGISVPASLTALAGFVFGAWANGRLPSSAGGDRARLLRAAVVTKLVLALPVVAIAGAVGIAPGHPAAYVSSALLATSMGMQNATVRRLAVPDLTTTVLTLTLTGLLADLRGQGWRRPATGYRLASVAFLFAGAAVGATLMLTVDVTAALGVGVLLMSTAAVVAHLGATRQVSWAPYPAG